MIYYKTEHLLIIILKKDLIIFKLLYMILLKMTHLNLLFNIIISKKCSQEMQSCWTKLLANDDYVTYLLFS